MLSAASGAQAGLIGVETIRITHASPTTYLQITEVIAGITGGGDAASLAAGAVASAASYGWGGTPDKAIDDLNAGGSHWSGGGEYHSAGTGPGEYLNIALPSATELDYVTIYGRSDCCSYRDIYDLKLFDGSGNLLFSATGLDATGTSHQVTVNLPDTSSPTPSVSEPGTLAIFGLGLAGLGFYRRKRAA
jgi:hypothetical protein